MKAVLFLVIFPVTCLGHPGIGVVKDSKGNIYYSDLKQVWKITRGIKTIAVSNVHSHELHIDRNDILYGENVVYDNNSDKFFTCLWSYSPSGKLDTITGIKQAYIDFDFSLARDINGTEYYIRRYLSPGSDSGHIYRRTADGKESVFARGNFRRAKWLHPQAYGSLLLGVGNSIYRVDQNGKSHLVKRLFNSGDSKDSAGKDVEIWGIWQDEPGNIYAAVYSDHSVSMIDKNGNLSPVHRSDPPWAPIHGLVYGDTLYLLENSLDNDVRLTTIPVNAAPRSQKRTAILNFSAICFALLVFIAGVVYFRRRSI